MRHLMARLKCFVYGVLIIMGIIIVMMGEKYGRCK
jgi:hypothetical protein